MARFALRLVELPTRDRVALEQKFLLGRVKPVKTVLNACAKDAESETLLAESMDHDEMEALQTALASIQVVTVLVDRAAREDNESLGQWLIRRLFGKHEPQLPQEPETEEEAAAAEATATAAAVAAPPPDPEAIDDVFARLREEDIFDDSPRWKRWLTGPRSGNRLALLGVLGLVLVAATFWGLAVWLPKSALGGAIGLGEAGATGMRAASVAILLVPGVGLGVSLVYLLRSLQSSTPRARKAATWLIRGTWALVAAMVIGLPTSMIVQSMRDRAAAEAAAESAAEASAANAPPPVVVEPPPPPGVEELTIWVRRQPAADSFTAMAQQLMRVPYVEPVLTPERALLAMLPPVCDAPVGTFAELGCLLQRVPPPAPAPNEGSGAEGPPSEETP